MKFLKKFTIRLFFIFTFFFLFSISILAQGAQPAQPKDCICNNNGKKIDAGKKASFQMCYRSVTDNKGNISTFDFTQNDKPLASEEWQCDDKGNLSKVDPNTNCSKASYQDLSVIIAGVPETSKVTRFGGDICSIDETLFHSPQTKNTISINDVCLGYEKSLYPAAGISSCNSQNFECQMSNTQYKDKIQKDFESCVKCYNIIDDNKNPIQIDKMSEILTQWTEIGCLYKNINPETTTNANFYVSISRIFYGLALLFALIKVIMSGYTLMNSANMDQIKEAKNEIIAIATAVLVFSSGIIVLSYVGIDVLGLDIKAFLPTFI